MTAAQENIERVRRWNDTFESEGFEAAERVIDEIFDPEVEFSPLLARELEGRTYHGHDGLRTFFRELNDTFGEIRYEQPEFHPVGDDVVVLFTRLVGTGRGSTVPLGLDLGMVYEFDDGLVRRLTAYGSRNEALRAAREAQRAQA
jgi:ketosteroid isomerase-like protein